MSALNTQARTAEQIEADIEQIHAQQRALTARVEPLMLELLRAKVHAVVPDAVSVNLYASEWENGMFYDSSAEVTCADGTVVAWDEAVADAPEDDAVSDLEDGGLDEMFLASLSNLYYPGPGNPTLVVDLVHLSATATA